MGPTLPLIVTFNLALAHHLQAQSEGSFTRKTLQVVLKLYEISYSFHKEHQEQDLFDTQGSMRFNMILANNLGEIHRLAGNDSKYHMCLQLLLSATMYLVDCGGAGATNSEEDADSSSIELEGFFKNTSHLILQQQCAGAA